MHPDRPDWVQRGICAVMILFGISLIVVAVLGNHLPGALRFLLGAGGIVIGGIGFCLALGVGVRFKASPDGGFEGSAEVPKGYTRKMTVSESLVEGSIPSKTGVPPPKEGVMPPKDGAMPAKTAAERLRQSAGSGPDSGGSAQARPRSSAEP